MAPRFISHRLSGMVVRVVARMRMRMMKVTRVMNAVEVKPQKR